MPSGEILMTAGTTAVVSVAATLTATQVFKWTVTALKPILKQTWTRITKRVSSSNSSSSSGQPDSHRQLRRTNGEKWTPHMSPQF